MDHPAAPSEPTDTPPRGRLSSLRLTRGDRYALAVALGFKVALLLIGTLGFVVFQNHYPEGYGLWPYLSIWNRWDATAYLAIADHGYIAAEPQYLAFFPLFPLLVHIARPIVFQDTLSAAFAVSTIASLFAAVQFYRLARLDLGPPAAQRAIWFLFAFPTAYFLHIGYTESLFLALTFGAIRAARTRRWWQAGILGAFAAAARMNGILLLALFATEAARDWRDNRRFLIRSLPGLLTLAGTGAYLLVNYSATGDAFAFMRYQRDHWHHHLTAPWTGVYDSFRFALGNSPANAQMVGTAEVVAAILVYAIGFHALRRRPASYGIWTLLNVALWSSNDFMMSGPRYALVAIPLFLLLGRVSVNRSVWAVATAISVLLQGLFAVIFAQGRWAY